MRAAAIVFLALLVLHARRAHAGEGRPGTDAAAPAAPAQPAAAPPASAEPPPAVAEPPPAVGEPPPDPNRAQREALFDIAFRALVTGRLGLAEQAFHDAAALPGDPVKAAVAESFVERVRRLRAERAAADETAQAAAAPPVVVRQAPRTEVTVSAVEDREGPRAGLLAATTVLGLSVYGWTLPAMLDLDPERDARAFVGLYMLTSGSAFLIPYLATRRHGLTPAQTNLAFYGGTRGLWHGVLLAALATGDIDTNHRFQLWAGSLALGSATELCAGLLFAGGARLTAGQARMVAVGGDFGLGWGFATGAVLGLHHDDHSAEAQARGMAAAGLLGSAAGITAGYVLGQRRDNSWGDGEVLRMAGLVGTWIGLTTNALLEWDPDTQRGEKKFFLTLIAGGAAGLWVGDRLVRPTNFSVGRSLIVDLGTVAGALGAAGVVYLFTGGAGSQVTEKGFLTASALGAIGAFGLAYWAASDDGGGGDAATSRRSAAAPNVAVLPALGPNGQRGLTLAAAF